MSTGLPYGTVTPEAGTVVKIVPPVGPYTPAIVNPSARKSAFGLRHVVPAVRDVRDSDRRMAERHHDGHRRPVKKLGSLAGPADRLTGRHRGRVLGRGEDRPPGAPSPRRPSTWLLDIPARLGTTT